MRTPPISAYAAAVVCCGALHLCADTFDRGMAAYRSHDYAAAAREFEKAVREQPNQADAYKMLGETYVALGTHWRAKPPLARVCELNPRDPDACYLLGRTCYALSLFAPALEAFQIAVRLPANHGRALAGMAQSLEGLGRDREADQKYRDAIAAGETSAALTYSKFLLRRGRPRESIAVLQAAAPKLPAATRELARVQREVAAEPAHATAAPPKPIRFRQSTLDMITRNGATGDKHSPETMMGGVAVLDYDNDGWPDIYIANGAPFPALRKTDPAYYNRLFRNNHNGTFTDVTARAGVAGEGYSMGVAAGDYDNDGHPDLFVAGLESNKLYHNRGDGTFEDVTDRAGLGGKLGWSVAAMWLDYDNDGLLDLFVVRYLAWDPAKDAVCSVLPDGTRQYCHPRAYGPMTDLLYHNEGHGRFRDVSKESGIGRYQGKGMSVVAGDADGDGLLDIFVTNDNMPNFLFHNEGHGKFREMALAAGVAYNDDGRLVSAMGADFRDYDNDGREDLFFTALSDELFTLYRNLGANNFANMTSLSHLARESRPYAGYSTGLYDFNNDGYKDIFVSGGHVLDNAELDSGRKSRQPNLIFPNQGDGTFALEPLPGEAFHRGAAFGDFNRDGKIDVVVARLNEKPLLLENVSPGAGHWIGLRLVGTRSNREGIGAMVHITTAGGQQWNRVATAVGYASSSDPLVHFGLGRQTTIRSIEIAWPSGVRQRLASVPADQYLTIREPSH
ncbi:MAG: FG-GAP-like repeat-containing protein [Bryobacteraceae bacterium]